MERRDFISDSGLIIGGMFFSAAVITSMKACTVDQEVGWTPQLLNQKQLELVAEVAEMILPRTDTPGAKDVQVEKRIDESLYNNYEKEEQRMFINGLKHIEDLAGSMAGKTFTECNLEERVNILDALVKESRQGSDSLSKHIYPMIKGLTILSFFNSEIVCKELLKYNPIPGDFKGNVPYSDIGGVWYL